MTRVYLTCEEVEIKRPKWYRNAEAIVRDRGETTAHLFFDCLEVEVKQDGDDPDFFDLIDGDNRVTFRFRDASNFTGDAYKMLEPDPVEPDEEGMEPADSPYDLPMTEAERNR